MPRFYFNAHRGDEVIADLEGAFFPDMEGVRKEAEAGARESLAVAIMSGGNPPECIEVVDSAGATVLTISLIDMLPGSMKM